MTLRRNCYAHLHGHSVGGTNPSPLEAFGASNLVIAHKNIFNLAVLKENGVYFSSYEELSACLKKVESFSLSKLNVIRKINLRNAKENFSWKSIADKYYKILINGIN